MSGDARLKSLAERIERVMDDIDERRDDIRDLYKEAHSAGYIPKVLRKAITRKRMDPSKRSEEDSILDLYDHALGNVGKALEAISKGATWDEAGKANGVPRATLARAAAVSKRREVIPDDPPPVDVTLQSLYEHLQELQQVAEEKLRELVDSDLGEWTPKDGLTNAAPQGAIAPSSPQVGLALPTPPATPAPHGGEGAGTDSNAAPAAGRADNAADHSASLLSRPDFAAAAEPEGGGRAGTDSDAALPWADGDVPVSVPEPLADPCWSPQPEPDGRVGPAPIKPPRESLVDPSFGATVRAKMAAVGLKPPEPSLAQKLLSKVDDPLEIPDFLRRKQAAA